ncbi:MAG: hypothetical protein KTR25_08795 [Myxococcales bacterium]|nr:hypothetical protein [Myxococcales bacterium]
MKMTSDGIGGDESKTSSGVLSDEGPRAQLIKALGDPQVVEVARSIALGDADEMQLRDILGLSLRLAQASGDHGIAARLEAEVCGYAEGATDVPDVRRATGFASAFPVRALDMGLLDPDEIFTPNNEKFSQVTLTIGQPVEELETALSQIQQGGVLALRVPASEVTHRSVETSSDTMVYIYILPREIQQIVDIARMFAMETVVRKIALAAVDEP